MEKYVEYVNSSLPKGKESKMLYDFKNHLIGEMSKRADELTARGLKDKEVMSDLIISEYPDVSKHFAEYSSHKTENKKTLHGILLNVLLSAAYIVVLVSVYLGISFSTHLWGQTWVLLVDGVILLCAYYIFLAAKKFASMRRIFHWFGRLLMAGDVILLAVCIFLFALAVLHLPKSWLIIICGVALMLLADGVFASRLKEPLAIFSWLAYIPAVAAMLFIVICAAGVVPWSVGWVIVPLSLLIDIAIAVSRILGNSKRRREVEDPWKEN